MKDWNDDRPAVARKNSPARAVEADLSVLPKQVQSIETLGENYSWLNHFRSEHPGFEFPDFKDTPWTRFGTSLAECKLALVTDAGLFVKGQKPFSVAGGVLPEHLLEQKFKVAGDPSYRSIPRDVAVQDLRVAHSHLDKPRVERDVNCVFPLERVRELVEETYVAEAAAHHFSLMGYLPDFKHLYEKTIPEIIQHLRQDRVTAVLLAPADCLGHQTVAIVQREIESQGIPTVSISLCRDITQKIGVPRAVSVRFPFGHTFGPTADDIMQMRIVKDALQVLATAAAPGEVVALPYQWVDE
ncbi:MAG: hypothetical protein HYX74_08655 [Acidobacteria bacterium]|nr:hypothetical protein [Acidobacteriota bacterium]